MGVPSEMMRAPFLRLVPTWPVFPRKIFWSYSPAHGFSRPTNDFSPLERDGWRSLRSAFASI